MLSAFTALTCRRPRPFEFKDVSQSQLTEVMFVSQQGYKRSLEFFACVQSRTLAHARVSSLSGPAG